MAIVLYDPMTLRLIRPSAPITIRYASEDGLWESVSTTNYPELKDFAPAAVVYSRVREHVINWGKVELTVSLAVVIPAALYGLYGILQMFLLPDDGW